MRSLFHWPLAAATMILAVTPACGSSDEAWKVLANDARKACTAQIVKHAGKAKVGKITGRVPGIGGDNGDRYYALAISGTVAGYTQSWLCLYDKQTHTATAGDIELLKDK
jgi:hypothetical protein